MSNPLDREILRISKAAAKAGQKAHDRVLAGDKPKPSPFDWEGYLAALATNKEVKT